MRYTGSKSKRCRAVGMNLYGNDKFDQAATLAPPGMHGAAKKKKSDYALHLLEKQKIKWCYGVSERQLQNLYAEAQRKKTVTGTAFLQFLELRLDNVVFRSGLLMSRDQARQLVSHGHVLVNGKRLSIPSARVKVGDEITFAEKSRPFVKNLLRNAPLPVPGWITLNQETLTVTVGQIPARDQIEQGFHENLVVEFYSR